MKTSAINSMQLSTFNNLKNNKKREKSNFSYSYSTDLFKKNENISFGKIKKISIKQIRKLINDLLKNNIHYELSGNANSASIKEFRHFTTPTKKTTFFLGGKKEEIIYKPDGITPNLKYKYQDDKLITTISYGQFGEKLFKESYYPNGLRKSKTIYEGVASFPKIKTSYYKDGKTIQYETLFHHNSRIPKLIKVFDKNGKIAMKMELNENKEIMTKIRYDKKGTPTIISEYSKTGNFDQLALSL